MLWNDELDLDLRFHHAAGLSYAEIALKMNTSRGSIAGRCHRLGLFLGKDRPQMKKPPPQKPKPKPLPVKASVVILPANSVRGAVNSVLAAHSRSCRFAVGDPREEGFYFCGQPTDIGKKYCSAHHGVVYEEMRTR